MCYRFFSQRKYQFYFLVILCQLSFMLRKKKLEQNIGKEEKIKDRQKNENMGKKNKKVFYV